MPRPSLKNQRSEEILDAYLTCVARFGLEGATQERIAAEAGVKRPLLRHYLGNREQMVAALCVHVVKTFNAMSDELTEALTSVTTPEEVVEFLFTSEEGNDPRLQLAWQALSAASAHHADMQADLLDSFEHFLDILCSALHRLAPTHEPQAIRAIAKGLAASFVTLDTLAPLSPPSEWPHEFKHAALLLVGTLRTQP